MFSNIVTPQQNLAETPHHAHAHKLTAVHSADCSIIFTGYRDKFHYFNDTCFQECVLSCNNIVMIECYNSAVQGIVFYLTS